MRNERARVICVGHVARTVSSPNTSRGTYKRGPQALVSPRHIHMMKTVEAARPDLDTERVVVVTGHQTRPTVPSKKDWRREVGGGAAVEQKRIV